MNLKHSHRLFQHYYKWNRSSVKGKIKIFWNHDLLLHPSLRIPLYLLKWSSNSDTPGYGILMFLSTTKAPLNHFTFQFTFVHGNIVGPTAKPSLHLSNNTRFTKKLFPVRYFPTILITPMLSFPREFKNCSASELKTNSTKIWERFEKF